MRKRKRTSQLVQTLNESPINYMSDLFIVAMVLSWIIVILIMVIMAVWATIVLGDTSVCTDFYELALRNGGLRQGGSGNQSI